VTNYQAKAPREDAPLTMTERQALRALAAKWEGKADALLGAVPDVGGADQDVIKALAGLYQAHARAIHAIVGKWEG
jgi:hypothetical protein